MICVHKLFHPGNCHSVKCVLKLYTMMNHYSVQFFVAHKRQEGLRLMPSSYYWNV